MLEIYIYILHKVGVIGEMLRDNMYKKLNIKWFVDKQVVIISRSMTLDKNG